MKSKSGPKIKDTRILIRNAGKKERGGRYLIGPKNGGHGNILPGSVAGPGHLSNRHGLQYA